MVFLRSRVVKERFLAMLKIIMFWDFGFILCRLDIDRDFKEDFDSSTFRRAFIILMSVAFPEISSLLRTHFLYLVLTLADLFLNHDNSLEHPTLVSLLS